MADNIKYRFIQNVGDYFPSGYFSDDFIDKVQKCAGLTVEDMKALCAPYIRLQHDYEEYKNFIINQNPRPKDAIKRTHDFNTRILKILGYNIEHPYAEPLVLNGETMPMEIVPVRHILRQSTQTKMLIMEMQHLIAVGEQEPAGLFDQQYESEPDRNTGQQRYSAAQWDLVFHYDREQYKICPSIINKAVTAIFLLPEQQRPHFILMLAGNTVFLFDHDKWSRGSYLEFSLDELFTQARIPAFRNYFALFHLLVAKQTLAADSEMVLMDAIIEESYKNAYEVTQDLQKGVVLAVETLANEALYYMKKVVNRPFGKYDPETDTYDETDDAFEAEIKDDCLVIVYRLLFIFYAESRPELEILPTSDEVYNRGYSLESLRDLEQVRLISNESRNGYFFDDSIRKLFSLLSYGHSEEGDKSFRVKPIDSPMFDNSRLKHLGDVRIRNIQWQEIIKALSLSHKKNYVGRISYANLGVNQLGSVYESLLAYRGFYTEEDYIEVHKADSPKDGTFLVPYSRMGDFDIAHEVLLNEDGSPHILPKGTFVYRLNGRDRQKSASYYTPEILTRSTVKYTLKSIIDEVRDGKRRPQELLDLKILEPAMGAAAFQNEVINQLAEAYMTYVEKKPAPDHYRDELQKVKAYIATHNVYGVDLNPTAIELGKLSLWLNVIHKDMETPFFSNRLALGNAVIGAWLKVYSKDEFYGIKGRKGRKDTLLPNKWWEHAPHKIAFNKNSVHRSVNEVYHFLLPDPGMLAVRTIKDYKDLARQENANSEDPQKPTYHKLQLMKQMIDNWTEAVNENDFRFLQRICAKIDVLLREYFQFQQSVENLTQNKVNLWGVSGSPVLNLDSYAEKERLNDVRYRHDNAYFRLKMVMDYWCSLWFWPLDEADSLPRREDYWRDIDAMLNVSDEQLDNRTAKALQRVSIDAKGQMGMFPQYQQNDIFMQAALDEATSVHEDVSDYNTQRTEEESEIVRMSKEEILTEVKGQPTTFFDDSLRFKVVDKLAKRYHFFHPMLEFLEVFWLRDGFDIICGNPPWLKLEFAEQGIIAEKYPEVALRSMIAPKVRELRDRLFETSSQLKVLYREEETENAASSAFLNAVSNYPLLVGQQTNLYKCVLENGFSMLSDKGFMGLLHQETVYDDPNGLPLRREVYHRLIYHFQYQNAFNLFAIGHREKYSTNVYGVYKDEIKFANINNLFHPSTIDACFAHNGHDICGGIKVNDEWNTKGHRDRIVYFTEEQLRVLADVFENGADWETTKLVSIHSVDVIDVLKALSAFPKHVVNYNANMSEGWHETTAVDSGIISRETYYPNIDNYEMVYNGPQIYVGNPNYKTPRKVCVQKADYDSLDLMTLKEDYIARSNYKPLMPLNEYKSLIKGFCIGKDENGNDMYDNWIDYYKVGFRKMINLSGERSLICAVLPRRTAHINGIISSSFVRGDNAVDMAALCAAVPMDAYMKIMASQNLTSVRIQGFPLGVDPKYNNSLRSRTLLLNCLTTAYSDLWMEMWCEEYKDETWSKNDVRLKHFSGLTEQWQWSTPLRNYFERRQALVEVDVIAAMALGLKLENLEAIYNIYFPVLQQNEDDTWYDQKGQIVFTCSRGLTGVGLDRTGNARQGKVGWEDIRGEAITNADGIIIGYQGTMPTYTHTIDPAKSELYGGQQQTFYAPYTRCDRIQDYRTAWAHFEKIFNKKQ